MYKMACKIAAVLLLGLTLGGCASMGANSGSSASGQSTDAAYWLSTKDRSDAKY